jgi:hypothetical protein
MRREHAIEVTDWRAGVPYKGTFSGVDYTATIREGVFIEWVRDSASAVQGEGPDYVTELPDGTQLLTRDELLVKQRYEAGSGSPSFAELSAPPEDD